MTIQLKWPDGAPETEFSQEFLQGMLNRMLTSWGKYGPVADAYPEKVNAIASLQKRLERYAETGNTEYLMDVANFAMIEFMHPRHAEAYFEATDAAASPGRVWNNGLTHSGSNNNREGMDFYARRGRR